MVLGIVGQSSFQYDNWFDGFFGFWWKILRKIERRTAEHRRFRSRSRGVCGFFNCQFLLLMKFDALTTIYH